jgi:hypothetical protein
VEFLPRAHGLINKNSNKPGRTESIKALAKEILKHGRLGFIGVARKTNLRRGATVLQSIGAHLPAPIDLG